MEQIRPRNPGQQAWHNEYDGESGALKHRQLLTGAAVLECFAGLALILAPGLTLMVLLGVKPDDASLMIGRIAGIALVALGVCCWGARSETRGAERSGTLKGITLYNAGVALFLMFFGSTGQARGVVVWIAALIHLGLAAEFVFWTLRARPMARP